MTNEELKQMREACHIADNNRTGFSDSTMEDAWDNYVKIVDPTRVLELLDEIERLKQFHHDETVRLVHEKFDHIDKLQSQLSKAVEVIRSLIVREMEYTLDPNVIAAREFLSQLEGEK